MFQEIKHRIFDHHKTTIWSAVGGLMVGAAPLIVSGQASMSSVMSAVAIMAVGCLLKDPGK